MEYQGLTTNDLFFFTLAYGCLILVKLYCNVLAQRLRWSALLLEEWLIPLGFNCYSPIGLSLASTSVTLTSDVQIGSHANSFHFYAGRTAFSILCSYRVSSF
eukprot:2979042-Amphidinium_carterae.3